MSLNFLGTGRFQQGSESQPHQFSSPKSMFRQQYFAVCDLMIQELTDRFEQKTIMEPVLALESLLLKAANGECFDEELGKVKQSVFQSDLDFDRLSRQLGVLVDVIHQVLPSVRKVTKVRTICDAMNVQDTYCACILLCLLHLQHQKEPFLL